MELDDWASEDDDFLEAMWQLSDKVKEMNDALKKRDVEQAQQPFVAAEEQNGWVSKFPRNFQLQTYDMCTWIWWGPWKHSSMPNELACGLLV